MNVLLPLFLSMEFSYVHMYDFPSSALHFFFDLFVLFNGAVIC